MFNFTPTSSNQLHIGDLHILLADNASGAPAALPADANSWRQLHDDEPEDCGWSS